LTLNAEIVSKRDSSSRPDAGILTTRSTLTNGEGVVVFECETKTLVKRRDG
jgi:acyl dehydratase